MLYRNSIAVLTLFCICFSFLFYINVNDISDRFSTIQKGNEMLFTTQIVLSASRTFQEKATSFPNETTQEFSSFPDETTQELSSFPDETTQEFSSFPDETTQELTSFPDETTQELSSFQEETATFQEKNTELLVNTESCKILDIDPYDTPVKHYFDKPARITYCDDANVITYIENGIIYINKTKKPTEVTHCRYQSIHRKSRSFKYGQYSRNFTSSISVKDEFIRVMCYNASNDMIITNFHINFVTKPLKEEDKRYKIDNPRLNILLVMFDSTSRINSLRYLKNTRQYLTETMGAIEMTGYNKVADNTFVNMIPLLTGEFADDLPCTVNKSGLDDCPFVWKLYKKRNYFTHFGEDWPMAGTFHYARHGFKEQPMDYYDRPFYVANVKGRKSGLCFHGKSEASLLLNRMYDLTYQLRDQNYFSFSVFSRNSHDYLAGLANLDNITKDTLSMMFKNNLLNNTFLAVFGDHGMRFGPVRRSFVGQMEERLPMMFMYLPSWFKQKYPNYMKNLKINSGRLTTHFDIHSTLLHLLDLNIPIVPRFHGKGMSLFHEISSNRTCQMAGISSHWCTCNYHLTVNENITTKAAIADSLVGYLNSIIKTSENKCQTLRLLSVVSCRKISLVKRETIHRIVINTKPGNGLFESTLLYNVTSKNYDVISDVSRVNKYYSASHCVNDAKLKKICVCK